MSEKVEFTIRIGPEMYKVLEEQMDKIKEATYGVCDSSFWEAGEVIAKKMLEK